MLRGGLKDCTRGKAEARPARRWRLENGKWLGCRWALHATNSCERLGFFRRHMLLKVGGAPCCRLLDAVFRCSHA